MRSDHTIMEAHTYKSISLVVIFVALLPVMAVQAGLDLSFTDTSPPAPLTDDVVPVGGSFSISVVASAPINTVAAVDFNVTWSPEGGVDYTGVSAGGFLPGALAVGVDTNTPGSQRVGVTTTSGMNTVESGTLLTLSFVKLTGEGSVTFGFSGISALNLNLEEIANVSSTPSGDISLPVVLTSMSAEVSRNGVTIEWHTGHELDNAGFNVLRSSFADGQFKKLNTDMIEGSGTSALPHEYRYVDSDVVSGHTYYYQIESVSLLGRRSAWKTMVVVVRNDALNPPDESELGQNFPNPCNPDTWIPYVLSTEADVKVEIYNSGGQLIRRIDVGYKAAGRYLSKDQAAHWDGRSSSGEHVPSGVYFYCIKAGEFVAARKLVVLQ